MNFATVFFVRVDVAVVVDVLVILLVIVVVIGFCLVAALPHCLLVGLCQPQAGATIYFIFFFNSSTIRSSSRMRFCISGSFEKITLALRHSVLSIAG